jgi:hypothetical protein
MCQWEQNMVELCQEACGASEPSLSKTSISVQVPAPSFQWNHQLDEMELLPLRDRTSK